jgi:predicted nuclease with TOPRIM domain
VQNFFGQKMVFPQFGNLTLCQAMVETMAGDQNLIGVRSRATLSRPFTVIREKQSEANMRFQAVIKKLEDEKAEAERKLNELQQARKDNNQRFILSPEQQAEIAKFRQSQAEVGKKLKAVRKELSQDIESLENRLKWMNIAGMPALVTIAGLALAIVRKQKTKAK